MRMLPTGLYKLHLFFAGQLLYPILLSSLLAGTLFVGRVLLSLNFAYTNLIWNLFLAWVPYLCSIWAAGLHRIFPQQSWMLLLPGILWLIFFPNAPYIITDFTHLRDRPYVPLWYDIGLFATFAWTGCFLAIASLRTMQIIVKSHLGWIMSWIFASYALVMGGLGIYLGRFSRWNSWDLFLHPKAILLDVIHRLLDPLSNLSFYGFTMMFTAFLFVCYLTFISVRRVNESDW
jgi:uncharacterized membrane protein